MDHNALVYEYVGTEWNRLTKCITVNRKRNTQASPAAAGFGGGVGGVGGGIRLWPPLPPLPPPSAAAAGFGGNGGERQPDSFDIERLQLSAHTGRSVVGTMVEMCLRQSRCSEQIQHPEESRAAVDSVRERAKVLLVVDMGGSVERICGGNGCLFPCWRGRWSKRHVATACRRA
ncbi:hypothetical protein OsJ_06429 [Oryza sativa Japonica Group]|uniref:Uncharacterized protein n=1 Tax=Oryza sativa subsp. japonica TaxID=39947 RepID=A3A615_ORYSJ|nr:hypothetical protein OsJ_06429 [Oryza sativa Japonica Group]